MAMSPPRWLKRNLFYFVTFLDSSSSRWPKAILRNATARVSSRGMVIAWPLAALAIHCRGVGNGVSQCKFVGIATCTRKGPCPTCRCRLHKRPRGQSVRRMGSRNRFLLALFQGIHFLPQGFKDADPRRYNYQHRTRQDHRALADSDKVHRDVPSYGQIFFGMRLPLLLQRQKAEAATRKIHSWQPQRVLLSHGRCFDTDADKVIRRIFVEPS